MLTRFRLRGTTMAAHVPPVAVSTSSTEDELHAWVSTRMGILDDDAYRRHFRDDPRRVGFRLSANPFTESLQYMLFQDTALEEFYRQADDAFPMDRLYGAPRSPHYAYAYLALLLAHGPDNHRARRVSYQRAMNDWVNYTNRDFRQWSQELKDSLNLLSVHGLAGTMGRSSNEQQRNTISPPW